ncbi:hypothetical protein R3P38DRAFT_3169351 [Favolaschia claudopus]|uniref:Uncharacterized protein n=1 Tax=Favolaschia claudopus TaxID=2862362 RepID=A0AAW0E153_9AGAR
MSPQDPEFPVLDEDEEVYPEMVSPETSSFFAHSHNFTIKGGHFAIHNHITAEQGAPRGRPKAFREIDWCDIFLEDNLDVVRARVATSGRCSVLRNIYSAKIEGQHNPDKTVVIYEGDGAKQMWYEDISKYLRVRHPRVLQLFGVSYSAGMFAAIFHRQGNVCGFSENLCLICHIDLVPAEHVIEDYSHEAITKIYFSAFLIQEYRYHAAELARMLQVKKLTIFDDSSFWLNTAGKLYIELGRRKQLESLIWISYYARFPQLARLVKSTELIPAHQLLEIIKNLTLEGFYRHFTPNLFSLALEKGTSVKFRPGSIIGLRLPQHERLTADKIRLSLSNEYASRYVKEVAFVNEFKGINPTLYIQGQGRMMENGWIRAKIPRYTGTGKAKYIKTQLDVYIHKASELFASQAVYIFSHVKNYSPLNFYVIVSGITIRFVLMPTRKRIQLRGRVSLFLPPAKDLLSPDGARLQYSNRAPYWSLHPSGNPPLAPELVSALGLPSVQTKISINGIFFSPQFYESIAQFHRQKGFDPTSQDVAREMGLPLYHLVDDETDPVQPSPLDFSSENWEDFSSDLESDTEDDSEDSSLQESSVEAESEGAVDGDVNEGPEPDSDDEQILYPRSNGF